MHIGPALVPYEPTTVLNSVIIDDDDPGVIKFKQEEVEVKLISIPSNHCMHSTAIEHGQCQTRRGTVATPTNGYWRDLFLILGGL